MAKRLNGEGTVYERSDRPGTYKAVFTWRDDTTGETIKKTFTRNSRKLALNSGKKWKSEMQAGLTQSSKTLTVENWINTWLNDYKRPQLRQKSYEKYTASLLPYVVPSLGKKYLQKVTTHDVQEMLNKLLESGGRTGTGLSTSTVQAVRKYFSSAVEQAVKLGYVKRNFVKDTCPPKTVTKEITILSKEELRALLKVAAQKDINTHAAILFAAMTGCRLGEVFGLHWKDVDLDNKTVYIHKALVTTSSKGQILGKVKTLSSKRWLPIPDELVSALKALHEYQIESSVTLGNQWQGSGNVFANKLGGYIDVSNFTSRNFKSVIIDAGLNPMNIHFHTLRHTFASLLVAGNVNPKNVQSLLGHSSVVTTLDIYTHQMQQENAKISQSVNSIFSAK